jgi:hypothetical protein
MEDNWHDAIAGNGARATLRRARPRDLWTGCIATDRPFSPVAIFMLAASWIVLIPILAALRSA